MESNILYLRDDDHNTYISNIAGLCTRKATHQNDVYYNKWDRFTNKTDNPRKIDLPSLLLSISPVLQILKFVCLSEIHCDSEYSDRSVHVTNDSNLSGKFNLFYYCVQRYGSLHMDAVRFVVVVVE